MGLVEHHHEHLTVKRQCELLSVNRSSTYRKPKVTGPDEETIGIMHKIDAIHTAHPTFGYRKITDILCKDALINHKRVHRLMKAMDIITIYPKPNLSKRYHAQYVKPYLLRNLKIVRPNQVWGVFTKFGERSHKNKKALTVSDESKIQGKGSMLR